MNHRLHQIQNWPERAQQADWCAATLAKNCGVSLRTLQRFFLKNMGKTPKKWLAEERQLHGLKVVKGCSCVKEAATNLGYKHTHHFSRDFKAHWGCCPAEMLARQTPNP
jgi:transcriptional regulator GlxA family with amidase domain